MLASTRSLLAALLLAPLVVTGCGNTEPVHVNRKIVAALLVNERNLPNGTSAENSPPERCGPFQILNASGARAVGISPTFTFAQVRVAEAIGVFETTELAAAAYDALNGKERFDCVREAIDDFDRKEHTVKRLPARRLGIQPEDSLVRYLVIDPESRLKSYVDVVSMLLGRCDAALLFLVKSDNPSDATTREVSETAAELLETDTCE